MHQNEDAQKPTLPAETSAVGPIADPKTENVKIEAPLIVPAAAAAAAVDIDSAILETLKAAGPSEPVGPASPPPTAAAAVAPVAKAAPAPRRAPRPARLFTPLAAAVVLASAVGAMAGALGTTGIAALAPLFSGETGAGPDPASVPAAIAQLRAEIGALKSSMEAGNRNTTAQFAKLSERFERIERAQAAAVKADMSVAKETTGAITPAPAATTAPLPGAAVPPSGPVQGWVLRDVYRGAAILQSRTGGMIEVGPGDILPGVGRIEAVRRQDGHWIVVTQKGVITSMR
jgi:hypothetical protein